MSKIEPTPGPWTMRPARKASNFGGYVAFVQNAPNTIAKVFGPPTDDSKIADANARLIAAVPDHHAAAIEIDRWALVIESAVCTACGRGSRDHEAVVAALKANVDAIAKARGTVTTSMSKGAT